MKNCLNFTFLLALSCTGAFAQDTLDGLRGWGSKLQTSSGGSSSPAESSIVTTAKATSSDSDCDKEDGTFVPYSELLSLLQYHKLTVDHDPDTGEIEVDGGLIVGNCHSMLKDPIIQKPTNGKPYLLFVEIQKPSDCLGDTCIYKTEIIDDNGKKSESVVSVAPNYEGFKECLKETGALDNPHKIITKAFNLRQGGLKETQKLAYYSNGSFSKTHVPQYGEFIGDDGKKLRGGKCETFENISNEDITILSEADKEAIQASNRAAAEQARLQGLYNQICDNGVGKNTEALLPQFEGTDFFQPLQELIRYSLLDSVRDLHDQVQEKSLKDVDAAHFNETLSKFYSDVISPLKEEIANLVISKRGKGKDGKAEIQKVIDKKLKEFDAYFKAPYLTGADYEKAKNLGSKAPLDKKEWRSALSKLYKIHNTRFYYSQYASSNKNSPFTPSTVDRKIASDVATEKAFVEKLGALAADKDKSFAGEYRQKELAEKQKITNAIQATEVFIQGESRFLQQYCASPSVSTYYSGDCQQAQLNIQNAPQLLSQYSQSIIPEITRYDSLASQWTQIESLRNGGTGSQPNPRDISTGVQQQQFTLQNQSAQGRGQVQNNGNLSLSNFPGIAAYQQNATGRNISGVQNQFGTTQNSFQTQTPFATNNFQNQFGTNNFQNQFGTNNFQNQFGTNNFQNQFGTNNFQNQFGTNNFQNQFGTNNFQNQFGTNNFQNQFGTTQSSFPGITSFQQNNGFNNTGTNQFFLPQNQTFQTQFNQGTGFQLQSPSFNTFQSQPQFFNTRQQFSFGN